jgi:hypothetical protein
MTYEINEGDRVKRMTTRVAGRRSPDWRSYGAVAGLAGGIAAALLGTTLTVISWLGGDGARAEKIVGTLLLVLTIPLLIFGAQCLDLMDKKKDRAREARFH